MTQPTNKTGSVRNLGIFGTFDVENYGDLLFPLVAEAELTRRLGAFILHRFSYHAKTADHWPYDVTPLETLPQAIGELDGVIIGGGDIIRFDREVAPGYWPQNPLVHHPTGYWMMPMLLAIQHGIPIAWNAPGVYRGIPHKAAPLLRLALEGSDYVSVRDEPSLQVLRRFSSQTKINRVPDTAFGIAHLVDVSSASPEFARLQAELGLTKPYLVVQAAPSLKGFLDFVHEHSRLFGQYRVVALPIGAIFGENSASFAGSHPNVIQMPSGLNPRVIAELIGQASAVVGTSLHLSISALAFGVPLFRPAFAFNDKYGVLAGFKGVIPFDSFGDIHPSRFKKVGALVELAPDVQSVLVQLEGHWDKMAIALSRAEETPPRQQALRRFSRTMPNFLTGDWTSRYAATMNQMKLPRERELRVSVLRRVAAKARRTFHAAQGTTEKSQS